MDVKIVLWSTTTVPPPLKRLTSGTWALWAACTLTSSCGLPEMPSTIAGRSVPSLMSSQFSADARYRASSTRSCSSRGSCEVRRTLRGTMGRKHKVYLPEKHTMHTGCSAMLHQVVPDARIATLAGPGLLERRGLHNLRRC